jgi:hypothetical protein
MRRQQLLELLVVVFHRQVGERRDDSFAMPWI